MISSRTFSSLNGTVCSFSVSPMAGFTVLADKQVLSVQPPHSHQKSFHQVGACDRNLDSAIKKTSRKVFCPGDQELPMPCAPPHLPLEVGRGEREGTLKVPGVGFQIRPSVDRASETCEFDV